MPQNIQTFNTKSAVQGNNRFDMSQQVVTTNDFGVMKPIYCRYCVPGDEITQCEVREFTRAMPMPAPTFGHIESITRCFFVPCRSVMLDFNEFISQNYSVHYSSSDIVSHTAVSVPHTDSEILTEWFIRYSTKVTSSDSYDFCVIGRDDVLRYYKFDLHAKRIYDMFNSIGLKFRFSDCVSSPIIINMMPVLALYKFYVDWVVPARFIQSYDFVTGYINSRQKTFTVKALDRLLIQLSCFIDEDFFTNSFESPSGQNSQTAVSFDWTSPNNDLTDVSTGDIVTSNSKYGSLKLSADVNEFDVYSLQTLGALQSMLNRGMLAGTKVQQWLYETFGIKPDNDVLNISTYLGKSVSNIQIGDVTSYADTKSGDNGSYLGQFAGKGVGSANSDNFTYKVKEHGYYIITNEIMPRASYVQGIEPMFLMDDAYDFFQPEFDNVGVEAVPYCMLNSTDDNVTLPQAGNLVPLDNVFSWTPRYAPLKYAFDKLSGDFCVNSKNTGLDSWYLARSFDARMGEYAEISPLFCDASSSNPPNNYDHIFQYTDNSYDHFYQIFFISCKMSRPMQSVSYFGYPQDEHGKPIDVKANGNIS